MWLINLNFSSFLKPGMEAVTTEFSDPTGKLQSGLMHKDIAVPILILPAGKLISVWYFHLIEKTSGNQKEFQVAILV